MMVMEVMTLEVCNYVCRLTVHRLAARTLIRSLEMEGETENEKVKGEVVKVSVQSGVSSTFTAFIGVNKDAGEVIQGPLLLRHIPAPSKCHPIKNSIPGFNSLSGVNNWTESDTNILYNVCCLSLYIIQNMITGIDCKSHFCHFLSCK